MKQNLLLDELKKLDNTQREILHMKYIENNNLEEISDYFGIKEDEVMDKLLSIMKILKNNLGQKFFD